MLDDFVKRVQHVAAVIQAKEILFSTTLEITIRVNWESGIIHVIQ